MLRSLSEGTQSLSAAKVLTAVLEVSPRPATRTLEIFAGTTLSIRVISHGEHDLTPEEYHRLGPGPLAPCCCRAGRLITSSGLVAANTVLTWLPVRLPPDARDELALGTRPAGVILESLGMRRTDRRAMAVAPGMHPAVSEDDAVVSSAVLEVGGQRVAIAEEHVTREFAESLAAQGAVTG
jgi:chorismate-pyruvate lyase